MKASQSLDVLGGIPLSGVNTVLFPYHGGASQMWNFVPTGDGYYEFSPASDLTARRQRRPAIERDPRRVSAPRASQWATSGG